MRKDLMMVIFFVGVLVLAADPAQAIMIGAEFAADYEFTDLGSVPSLPPSYGGLTLLQGDPNTLLIGGSANAAPGALYTVGVTRGADNHISGFSGVATFFAAAPFNDGGVVFGPSGVLFASQWPVNKLGQYLPGSVAPDKVIDLVPLGVASSHAAINFVPAGFSGAGQMKLVSWSGGQFYTAEFSPDGAGTFDITSVTHETTLPGGPEGFVYIAAGNAGFPVDSLLLSEWSAGKVGAYEIDADGNPIPASRREFLSELSGAEGAFIDPLTGDFLFSTFGGGDRVVVVRGFLPPDQGGEPAIPEPSSIILLAAGISAASVFSQRLRRI
ncbi:MAG: PEP-CTERM sorting domain-containing protein [Candidatus Omnitrophica bacterium]|nr:PEP-CTERM sorting domain-containing protein [Candidatus Omnitrophota bacterium]